MSSFLRTALLVGLGIAGLVFVPPVVQNPLYHLFADGRMLYGVPNFWNVVSNAAFLVVALYGLAVFPPATAFEEAWERWAYGLVLLGTAGVAAGSAYYHWRPDNGRLFWDRLPMTVVFAGLVAAAMPRGRWALGPLLALGVGSVLVWRWTGDLRLYGLVQFGAMLALAVLAARFPERCAGVWGMGLFYVLAKVCEAFDGRIGGVLASGGHPWKHVCAAVGMGIYVTAVGRRRKPSEVMVVTVAAKV